MSDLLHRISDHKYYDDYCEDDDDDDDDDDDIEEYSLEEWEAIARQIRSLSNTIWLAGEHDTLNQDYTPLGLDLLSVYRSWATLLTRDSRNESVVAVTGDGSTIVNATRVIAVVPYQKDLLEIIPSPECYTGGDYHMLHRRPIDLRPESILFDSTMDPSLDDAHGQIILNIVYTLAEEPDSLFFENEQRQSAFRFIYSQCWPEVLACAKGANHLPQNNKTWHDLGLLARYTPLPDELPAKRYELVPFSIAAHFSAHGLEQWTNDQDSMSDARERGAWFVFGPETASTWFSILCDAVYMVLYQCQLLTEGGAYCGDEYQPPPTVMDDLIGAMTDLYTLFNFDVIQRLLSFRSLHTYLDAHPYNLNQEIRPQLSNTRRAPRAFTRSDYKVLEEWRDPANILDRMVRHMTGLLSWHSALITLVSATAHSAHPITLQLVPFRRPTPKWREELLMEDLTSAMEMDHPAQSARYIEVWRYVNDGIPENLDVEAEWRLAQEIDERATVLDIPNMEDVHPHNCNPVFFQDSVHTEALLMDFLAQGEHVYQCNFSPEVLRQTAPGLLTFVDSRRTFNKIIGIPLQYDICYCCRLLERRLLHGLTEMHSTIAGPIVPWTPPLLCHNDEALESLQGALFQTLADIIKTLEEDTRACTPTANMAGHPIMDMD